ncbi:hypothetical protein D0Z70_22545 [Sphingobium terrigena]|uniref:Uncharacterized protein n=1 Tax=Sphingobium terrigena TaxID=2304063 RepID=A0A418YLE4_9SPHN|nr:hypothetical protein D0Z70_22545 [Sphingobium terrigena]
MVVPLCRVVVLIILGQMATVDIAAQRLRAVVGFAGAARVPFDPALIALRVVIGFAIFIMDMATCGTGQQTPASVDIAHPGFAIL